MSVFPRYIPLDATKGDDLLSSVRVLRVSDNARFLATRISDARTKDVPIFAEKSGEGTDGFEYDSEDSESDDENATYNTKLASVILPTAALSISRILNHPNIISLVDIDRISSRAGTSRLAGPLADLTIWEDMNAGSLAYIVPSANALPPFDDKASWSMLAAQNYGRFSLPESLCWHVLRSISRALLWLHYGVKETAGVPGEYKIHDEDWQPILIMDVSPSQIWFKKPDTRKGITYGDCKLGGFQTARVTGNRMAIAESMGNEPIFKQYYHAPEIYTGSHPWTRASEIWSLGAVVYTMMTGIPPPRMFDYAWQVSRMCDKGFSEYVKPIIQDMLQTDPAERPDTFDLVDMVDNQWRQWRGNTTEGRELFDKDDEKLSEV